MADQPIVMKKVPPKPQSKQDKKKKEKGPSKRQPAWLFPPDEENPVLNPKERSHEEVNKAIKEREKAVDYMQRRVHGVPDRPAPDPLLLTLIGIFLTDFGFNSTSRLFTNERQARQNLKGWEEALGKKIDKNTPKLEQIFRDWHRDWLVKQGDDTSSSESSSGASDDSSSDEGSEAGVQVKKNAQLMDSEDNDSSSTGSDVEMKDISQPKKDKKKSNSKSKSKKVPSPSPSLSSSSSDSDADDEKENAQPKAEEAPKKAKQSVAAKPTVADMVNKLKRKARTSSPELVSDPSEDEKPIKVKKRKTESTVSTPVTSVKASKPAKARKESTTKSSKPPKPKIAEVVMPDVAFLPSSSSSESETSAAESAKAVTLPAIPTASSDSSVTINGDSKKPSTNASPSSNSSSSSATSTSSSSDSDTAAPPPLSKKSTPAHPKPTEKKTPKGAKPTPLATLSTSTDPAAHPSNKYQSYDYADRAYKDLSVTRGKGFTKEKNKKKRGSYRGGLIDVNAGGGKSFKFED
jgi:SRP40, C-terminal domain